MEHWMKAASDSCEPTFGPRCNPQEEPACHPVLPSPRAPEQYSRLSQRVFLFSLCDKQSSALKVHMIQTMWRQFMHTLSSSQGHHLCLRDYMQRPSRDANEMPAWRCPSCPGFKQMKLGCGHKLCKECGSAERELFASRLRPMVTRAFSAGRFRVG